VPCALLGETAARLPARAGQLFLVAACGPGGRHRQRGLPEGRGPRLVGAPGACAVAGASLGRGRSILAEAVCSGRLEAGL
jgi:hypothetical protein